MSTRSNLWPAAAEITGDDPYFLHEEDHPGLILISHHFNGGNNFLIWKRLMIIALGAKSKLQFVDGTLTKPDEKHEMYALWKKVDLTVLSWILNTLSTELSETFVYAETSELWDSLNQIFGDYNGIMRYKIRREISNLVQGSLSMEEYFNKLSKLWHELQCLDTVTACTCEAGKVVAQHNREDKLIQFLMGLNSIYNNLKFQIMLLDPLPSVDKAYSMLQLLTAERQRSSVDMATRSVTFGRGNGGKSGGSDGNWSAGIGRGFIKLTKEDKAMLLCEHCGFNGHEVSNCFKKYGIPEWYKELKGKKYINQHNPDQKKGRTAPDHQVILQQFQDMAAFMKEKVKNGQNMNYDQFVDF